MKIFSAVIIPKPVFMICVAIIIIVATVIGCQRKIDQSFQKGEEIFKSYCVACHGLHGNGVLFQKSALNNSIFVVGNPNNVIAVILYGREGAGTMPGWNMTLNDREVAAVATYIRQAWSNRAAPVTPAMVAKIRQQGKPGGSSQPLPLE
jgi:mono/diheme cytochrome c family protein